MSTVTIPKKEYRELLDKKLRYEYLRHIMEGNVFAPPPTRGTKRILADFRATKLYSPAFLSSLKRGLKRSSYFTS